MTCSFAMLTGESKLQHIYDVPCIARLCFMKQPDVAFTA